jgi:hypothetical protein
MLGKLAYSLLAISESQEMCVFPITYYVFLTAFYKLALNFSGSSQFAKGI